MTKAAIVSAPDADVEIKDITLPAVGSNEVRVRIQAAGVCHSDLSMIDGTIDPQYPVILGHEASGTIVEVGADVTDAAVGDRIVFNWAAACRQCWFCENGEPWLCTAVEGVVTKPRGPDSDGRALNAALGIGAFAEETVVPARSVVALPAAIGFDIGALMGCAVLTGTGAVLNTAEVPPGARVAVFGLGGIGLSTVIAAKHAGASQIIAVDVNDAKKEVALALGATDFVSGHPKVAREIRKLADGRGVDHAFECVGRADTVRAAWQSARRGGHCTVVGVGRADDHVHFSAMELFHFSRILTSSVYGSSDPERDIPRISEQVENGEFPLQQLITHRITLDQVGEAFERMRHGQGIRSVIEF